jgi:galactokinase
VDGPGGGAARIERLLGLLEDREAAEGWPASGPVAIVRAPGRVNLIGEHTDYNEGLALPAAIDREVWIAFRPAEDGVVALASAQAGRLGTFRLADLGGPGGRTGDWIDYVAGTAWAMREAGLEIRGFRGALDSDVPVGSGLSSSAAMELAASWALAVPGTDRPAPARMAAICQRAENAYVGVNCGIMDQFASAAGRADSALLLDCRSLEAAPAPLPPDLALVVCDTSSPHRLEASAYNERRGECEAGVRIIAAHEPGVRALRDVDEGMLERYRALMPERVAMRCEHVVREDARVTRAVAALAEGDLDEVGALFAASHASLRDLYEVSSPELDLMVDIAASVPGVVAARMTGAGFGGCTVNLVRPYAVDALRAAVMERYPAATGLHPAVYATRAVDGAGPVAVG